ncbi:MAG: DUF3300 domain-containing protein [Syntrophobacteraceae bacterium]|nr:DUF3300 domain-containing protein [Syntrophobacteraceae bacterium]
MRLRMRTTCALVWTLAVLMVPCGVFAQEGPPPPPVVTFSQGQLDQMLAPIALYPDSLLAQILLAATYPQQVIEADHWMMEHQGLRGPALNDALDAMNWDLSVKALAPFPQILDMMAKESEWTQNLGEAFLAQQIQVMGSVQRLRRRARTAGNLRTTVEQRVIVRRECIEIVPVNPAVVYVPRYNPVVVYGGWWWPAYPPLAYYPVWSGVVVAPVVGVFGFWGAVTVGPVWGWGWGSWGWHNNSVFLNVNRTVNINNVNVTTFRSSFRTTSLHQAAMSGRFGARSSTWRGARTSVTRSGAAGLGGRGAGGSVRSGGFGRGGHFGASATTGSGRSAASYQSRRAGFHGGGFSGRRSANRAVRSARGGRSATYGGRASRTGRFGSGAFGSRGGRGSFGRNRSFGRAGSGRFFGGTGREGGGFGRGGFAGRGTGPSFGPRRAAFGGRGFGGFNRRGGAMRASARPAGGGGRGGRRR